MIDDPPPYVGMFNAGLCTVTGFDPQAALLPQSHEGVLRYFPYAIGDGHAATLHVCVEPGMTSLYEMAPQAAALFPGFAEWGRVVEKKRIATYRLEDLGEVEHIDFLRIDAQGSEASIIESAGRKLDETVVVQAEVQFTPLYKGAPLFAEFDQFMRWRGFALHTFAPLRSRRLLSGREEASTPQLFDADAVYVRDFARLAALDDDALSHMALIVSHCFGSTDLAALCRNELQRRGKLAA